MQVNWSNKSDIILPSTDGYATNGLLIHNHLIPFANYQQKKIDTFLPWQALTRLPHYQHCYAYLYQHFQENDDIIPQWFEPIQPINHFSDKKDRQLYHLNLLKLADHVANLLAKTDVFYKSVTTLKDKTCCVQAGFYVPRGTVKCPVYVGVAIDEGELDAIINFLLLHQTPAIMLLPSLDNVPQDVLQAIYYNNKAIIGLDSLQQGNTLIHSSKAIDALKSIQVEQNRPKRLARCKPFPTPSGASWRDITIEIVNNAKINVTCCYKGKRVFESYDYAEMGMIDNRTKLADQQWDFLCGFAEEYGYFTWDNRHADRKHKKTKQRLIKLLKAHFGIYDSDPFVNEKDEKGRVCYRAVFKIRFKDE